MKSLFASFLFLLSSISVFASCLPYGVSAFPKSNEISQNSILMVEGYAWSQNIIIELNKKYPIYLQSDNHQVKLTVKETCEGEFSLTQAILNIEGELIIGKKYNLQIDSLNEEEREMHDFSDISWTVKKNIDSTLPAWNKVPKHTGNYFMMYGCGPDVYANFEMEIADNSETLVKTELIDLKTNEKTIYYLQHFGGKLSIGHGMCAGAFNFGSDRNYKVRFDLVDASGNTLNKWTDWVEFDSPILA